MTDDVIPSIPPHDTLSVKGARIIILLGQLELGGSQRQALLLARHLRDQYLAEVEIWGKKAGRLVGICDEHNIPWHVVEMPLPWSHSRVKQLVRLLRFAWILRASRPDVILPYEYSQGVIGGVVWRLTGAKACVWNESGSPVRRIGGRPEQFAIRHTSALVANSEASARFLAETLEAPQSQISIIRRGVELEESKMDRLAWREQQQIDPDCFVACMVANLKRSNDHVTLLKAWRIVVDRMAVMGRKAVLLLAGRFDETHESLKALAYDLELFDEVRFPGQVKDISGLARAADLCVHSSMSESCPYGVLECMAAGLPVAATDSPGVRDAVGSTGYPFLALPGNEEELAGRVLSLAQDPAMRAELGAANRQRIEAEFSQSRMCEQTVAVIVDGLSRRTSPPANSVVRPRRSTMGSGTAADV